MEWKNEKQLKMTLSNNLFNNLYITQSNETVKPLEAFLV